MKGKAKTKLPELLRGIQVWKHFTSNMRGKAVAVQVPAKVAATKIKCGYSYVSDDFRNRVAKCSDRLLRSRK